MKNLNIRFAGLAMALTLVLIGSNQVWAQNPSQIRLTVRKNKVINGIEAQLRGDYRENRSPLSLNSELENINIPLGKPVAFCLVRDGVAQKLGVGRVALVGGIHSATVELSARDGDFVPAVQAGDVLQARQATKAQFRTNPGCGAPLLVSGLFN